MEEVHNSMRTKEITKFNNLKVDDTGEGLSVSRGIGGTRGNQENSKVGDKSKDNCFKCHKTDHFKRDCYELGGNDYYVIFSIGSEDYVDVVTLVVSCWVE